MPKERRYNEQEIAAIFEQAAQAQAARQHGPSPKQGLTLAELQEVGQEVGLSPEAIAEAVRTVGFPSETTTDRTWGVVKQLARTVNFPEPFSDEDWELLVVDLRDTFGGKGEIKRDGTLREWTYGNVHALVEPTDTGSRLRIEHKATTVIGNLHGSAMMGSGALFLTVLFLLADKVVPWGLWAMILGMVACGVVLGMVAYWQSPRWEQEQVAVLEHLAARATALAADDTQERRAATTRLGPQLDLNALPEAETDAPQATQTRTRA